jgi:hypothetical protein
VPNDYGVYNVVVRNIDRAIKHNQITDSAELDGLVNQLKDQLESNRSRWQEAITNRNTCQHSEFGKTTYTVQRRIMGYVTVYERSCKSCGYVDVFSLYSESEEKSVLPDWTIKAEQRYYNNFI